MSLRAPVLLAALALASCLLLLSPPPPVVASSYRADSGRLLFADEFDELDLEVWQHEITLGGGGNWEFQYYTNNRSNSFVRDGVLFLKPTLTMETLGGDPSRLVAGTTLDLWGSNPADQCTGNAFYGCSRTAGAGGNILNPIQSARLRTAEAFSFKYGRVEVRAKVPKGDWIWPAIWLLPRFNTYGGWPASGEIDLMESRGNGPSYAHGGRDTFGSTLHWGPDWAHNQWEKTHQMSARGLNLHEEFHVYGLRWDSTGLYTYLDEDSNRVLEITFPPGSSMWKRAGLASSSLTNPWEGRSASAPFDQKFYLIMNVAVGGTGNYFPDGVGGKPWTNNDPHAVNAFWNARGQWYPTWVDDDVAMQIDWVHVYGL